MYAVAGPALLRAAARPAAAGPSWWPDLADTGPHATANWRAWLQHVWSDADFAAAVEVGAGPQLAARVREVVFNFDHVPRRRLRRLTASVMQYALRQQRPTPFGLFAGVTAVPFGEVAAAPRWGASRVVARPDARWLASVVRELEEAVGDLLPVTANQLRVRRGERVVLPVTRNPQDSEPAEVSVRATGPVLAVLEAADGPVSVTLGELADRFPAAPADKVRAMLSELVRQGFLISILRLPTTVTDPLGHLLAIAHTTGLDQIPAAEATWNTLRTVREQLARHNELDDPTKQQTLRTRLTRQLTRQPGWVPGGSTPLMVDLRLDAGPAVLPERVASLVAGAAEVLTRLSPFPDGHPVWVDYHRRFAERFGPGAVVPVLELVNPDTGMGFPARYRDSVLPDVPPQFGRRDAQLLALAQMATVERLDQVDLNGPLLERLAPDPVPDGAVQPHAELTVRLSAYGVGPFTYGAAQFAPVVQAVPRGAGTTAGRFLYLLEPERRRELEAAITAAPPLRADALVVQVSAPPLYARAENVSRAPALLPLLALGEYPQIGEGLLRLEELGVCADERRMWLVRFSDRRPVEVRVLNAVDFRANTDPLVRFLCEITHAHTPWLTAFNWGAAGQLPYLPRVRYGEVVLSPARWHLPAADLPGKDADWEEWRAAAGEWIARYNVPATVYLSQQDLRLPLDLRVPEHLVLLRDHLLREPTAILIEAPRAVDNQWCGRAHEVTVQLHSTRTPLPAARPRPGRPVTVRSGHLPGASGWLSARLFGNPRRADELLARVPGLAAGWVVPPQWWFLRHTDPEPHVRLRIPVSAVAAWSLASERIGRWAEQMREEGLLTRMELDTYLPESGRYGRGAALRAAEEFFSLDSRTVLAQLAYQRATSTDPATMTAASMLDLATALLGREAGHAWLLERVPRHSKIALPRSASRLAAELADRPDQLELTAEGRLLSLEWRVRAKKLADYRRALCRDGELEPADVLGSLLHLHHARAVGLNPASERTCHRLARAAALTLTARTARAEEGQPA
ncbi:lantibiotic dehydratase [Kitasatospora sp. YST-16]|uniref:lantibiotic dehydratase n=1 Tax=Kitasatospora sp. YST-16 TaxID=2998080 RepID=UPI0022853432|nr:lantibiotic dehydratase [Kitasatospora sp. YST-16]WAL70506.1 lantibiotic dehydratase [Kitasatospora sp. YST-16]WNW36546.1 lantibiotic dehydratase [Streptomyces sp. Li-HN-5-13]